MKDINDSPQLPLLFGPGRTVNSLPASASPGTTHYALSNTGLCFFSVYLLLLLCDFPHYLKPSIKGTFVHRDVIRALVALTLVLISHQICISTVFSPSFWTKLPSGSSEVYILLGTGLSTYATLMRHIPQVPSGEQI